MGDKSLVMPADYFCVSSFTQCSSIIFVWQIFQPVRQKITEQRHWLSVSVCASYGGWWLAPLSPECSWSSWWLSWSSPHCPFVTVFKPGPALHHVTAKLTPPPPLHKYNCHLVFCIVKLVKKNYLLDSVCVLWGCTISIRSMWVSSLGNIAEIVYYLGGTLKTKTVHKTCRVALQQAQSSKQLMSKCIFLTALSPVRGSKSSMTFGNHAS